MAIRNPVRAAPITTCPKCNEPLLTIDGTLTKWLRCPKCKWSKLEKKSKSEMNRISVTPL